MKKLSIVFSRLQFFSKRNNDIFYIAFGVIASIGIISGIFYNFFYQPNVKQNAKTETAKENKEERNIKHQTPPSSRLALEVDKDSVVMGNVPPNTKVGEGSVVIGPTDNKGNTIINTPNTAIGRGAKAGPGSIAIGARAGAGAAQDVAAEKEDKK